MKSGYSFIMNGFHAICVSSYPNLRGKALRGVQLCATSRRGAAAVRRLSPRTSGAGHYLDGVEVIHSGPYTIQQFAGVAELVLAIPMFIGVPSKSTVAVRIPSMPRSWVKSTLSSFLPVCTS